MEFRDLKKQYRALRVEINQRLQEVLDDTNFIQGRQVNELEAALADYTGVKHCITCANGTDALQMALMAWDIGEGAAVFVPDFTFFSTGEAVAVVGGTPVFVDVRKDTYNIDTTSLENAIKEVLRDGRLTPKAVIAVDLFGQPAEYPALRKLTEKYGLLLLEDAAQGFGGAINDKKACSFADIAITSFFPAKPLGCYGDGGAIFTDNDEWDELLRSFRVHGKGESKYENIRIGMNSRLDTIQAAVLLAKFRTFVEAELDAVNNFASVYTDALKDLIATPVIKEGFYSSWAQYTIQLKNATERNGLQRYLGERNIPSMIYYPYPMHRQKAFLKYNCGEQELRNSIQLCNTVLSLPMHPYLERAEIEKIVMEIKKYMGQR